MAEFFRRFAMGCVWFVIFTVGLGAVGGAVAGVLATRNLDQSSGTPQEHFDRGFQAGRVAGVEFHRRFGHAVTFVAIVLAVGGTVTGVLPGTGKSKVA